MPEGDTLRRAAARVGPLLLGEVVEALWFRKLRGVRPRVGERITRVDAIGKHLQIEFSGGLVLDTHLGMAGRWRTTAESVPWSNPRLRIVITTKWGSALCFAAPSITTHPVGDAGADPTRRLGPDLSDDQVDLSRIVERSRTLPPDTTLATALLDQRVAAGVGNVFKSEALFVARLFPFTSVGELGDRELEHLWRIAHEQLVANRSRPVRVTTPSHVRGRMFVYRRDQQGCRRCDAAIQFSPAGDVTERSTYWCPRCQPPPARAVQG